jgi:hypothetical protein
MLRLFDSSVGSASYVLQKFLLQDPRFSDARRSVSFDRITVNAGEVQGLLYLQAALQQRLSRVRDQVFRLSVAHFTGKQIGFRVASRSRVVTSEDSSGNRRRLGRRITAR